MIARIVGFRGSDLEIARGDVILLRGPNGSGKTSLLRALAGLPSAIVPTRVECHARVAYSPQDARDALVGLTVAGEFRLRRKEVPARLVTLTSRASTQLSSGETRQVALGAADGAELLLLDEPSEGLDSDAREVLSALVVRTAKIGAVVLADHGHQFDALATRIFELAPAISGPLPPMPIGEGAPVLRATLMTVRGRSLPALSLAPGFHVLQGPNGAGKSTMLLRLVGLLESEGVSIDGAAPSPGQNVRLLLPHAGDLLTRERVSDECAASPLVPAGLAARHPLAISGGEAQRVALAKVLGVHAPCYLLDEPEAHLDAEGRALLVELIGQRVKQGACVLAATHDVALAALAQSGVFL